jgi:hypothetical protein
VGLEAAVGAGSAVASMIAMNLAGCSPGEPDITPDETPTRLRAVSHRTAGPVLMNAEILFRTAPKDRRDGARDLTARSLIVSGTH